ncbi:unnamed protein product [Auanema sp. JU1783]|nr:unnamed protein product [Auanema sp. JU1783]
MIGNVRSGILLLEPVVTVRQTASLPGSISMNVISKDFYHIGNDVIEIDVDWGDTVVAMSSGYKLEKEHTISYHNLQYVFKAKHNNTQFDVEVDKVILH